MSPTMLSPRNLALLSITGSASGHMLMSYPPALRYKDNPYSGDAADYSLTSPLSSSGSDFPCHGSLDLLGTAEATAVASWTAGQKYNMTITGGAPHDGGSCQASVSLDKGKSFTVIHSYVGGCPAGPESSFEFRLPADTPASDEALFAWTWHNKVGNREMYMNCAVVEIQGSGSGSNTEKVHFANRPAVFEADIGNGCTTVPTENVKYPNPGPDVDVNDSAAAPATGECEVSAATAAGNPGGSSGGGFATGPPAVSTAAVPAPSISVDAGGSNLGSGATGGSEGGSDSGFDSDSGSESDSGSGSGSDGFVPGNDWPDWFSRASRNVVGGVAVPVVVLAIGFMLY